MKRINKFLILVFAILLFGVANSYAQVYLKKVPPPVQKKIPPRSSKYEIWVPEDWVLVGTKYVHRDGYWEFPPTPKSHYVKGYWKKSAAGYERIPGYWLNPR